MPTTISTSPRAWRQPAVATGRPNDLLACTALSVIGLLLAVLVVNFEINRAQADTANAGGAVADQTDTIVPGIP
jgi:hypothetical protein